MIQDEAADRVARITAELNAQRRIEVLNAGSRLDAVAPAPIDLDVVRRFVKVVFVLDIADNLFEYVLDRNQAADPGVFINDDRHVIMRDAELAQQDIEALRFGNEYRWVSVTVIADRVGHESIDITYRYAHLFPSKQKEMADSLTQVRVKTQNDWEDLLKEDEENV